MKKIINIILGLCIIVAIAAPSFAENIEAELEAANNRQEELEADVANSQARLEELQASKADIEQKIAEIDAEISQVDALISQYSSEAEVKEGEIADMEETISDQEKELDDKYEKMKVRIKYMYENLDANYIEAVFSSTNFGEMFEKMEYLSALNKYDRQMMDEIEKLMKELEENKATVEEELSVVQALGDAQEEQKAVLDGLQTMKAGELSVTEDAISEEIAEIEALNAMLEANAGQIASLSAEFDEMMAAAAMPDPEAEAAAAAAEAEAQRLAEEQAAAAAAAAEAQAAAEAAAAAAAEEAAAQEEAQRLADEAAAAQASADAAAAAQAEAQAAADAARAQAAASGAGAGVATGTWIWPLPGYSTISSGFGPRGGGYHYGVDIPAPTGTTIVAVDGGKVVMARWSASADTGLYTVIYHGNGVYSEYMHQSNIFVSEGDIVAQGQAIGAVGNTGQSYGSHLHISKGLGSSYWLNRVAPF